MTGEVPTISESFNESLEAAITATSEYLQPPQQIALYRTIYGLVKLPLPQDGKESERRSISSPLQPIPPTKIDIKNSANHYIIGAHSETGKEVRWILLPPNDAAPESDSPTGEQWGLSVAIINEQIFEIRLLYIQSLVEPDNYPKMIYINGAWTIQGWYFIMHQKQYLEKFSFLTEIA